MPTIHINALGMVEFNSIAVGIEAADAMLKVSKVDLVIAKTVCSGKYICAVRGDTAAVRASVEEGTRVGAIACVDSFVIPNLHPDVFPALIASTHQHEVNAIGVIETFSVASAVLAGDRAAKTASISLMEIHMAIGIGGKAFVTLTGDVAAVRSAVEGYRSPGTKSSNSAAQRRDFQRAGIEYGNNNRRTDPHHCTDS